MSSSKGSKMPKEKNKIKSKNKIHAYLPEGKRLLRNDALLGIGCINLLIRNSNLVSRKSNPTSGNTKIAARELVITA